MPLWVVTCLLFIIWLYMLILTITITLNMRSHSPGGHQPTNQQTSSYHALTIQNIQSKWLSLVFYTMLLLSVLMFEVLLVNKLENEAHLRLFNNFRQNYFNYHYKQQLMLEQPDYYNNMKYMTWPASDNIKSYLMTSSPLYLAYLALILLSFNSRHGNVWWFGLGRHNFCDLFLTALPVFKTYGNVAIK